MNRDCKVRKIADRLARECLGVRLRMVHRAVSGIYDEALRPHGLRIGQMTILVAVAYMGSVKPSRFCRVMHMEKSTLSRDAAVLLRKGWLEVESDADGRGQTLRLSQDGEKLLERVFPSWEQAQRQAEELLGEDGVTAMHRTAQKLGFPVCRT
jgi:DNA-binding MarR family transcriptional regulator